MDYKPTQHEITISLLDAARDRHFDKFPELIAAGADVNFISHHGESALYWTAAYGNKKGCEHLIKAGVDVNARFKEGRTALYLAACWRNLSVGRLLIYAGAEVNTEVHEFKNPLKIYPELEEIYQEYLAGDYSKKIARIMSEIIDECLAEDLKVKKKNENQGRNL